jgi:hypothetical protein
MRKVSLGKPLANDVNSKLEWVLKSIVEIELASAERDPEFDNYIPASKTVVTEYDPPNIGSNGTFADTFTVTGALVGQPAFASFSDYLETMILTAEVVADDTVEVIFHNITPGAVDLAEGTLTIVLMKP